MTEFFHTKGDAECQNCKRRFNRTTDKTEVCPECKSDNLIVENMPNAPAEDVLKAYPDKLEIGDEQIEEFFESFE